MNQDAAAKRLAGKRLMISVLIGITVLLVVFALVALSIMPVKYEIVVGEVAPATITSSRDITDEITTDAAKAEARVSVSDMYTHDSVVTSRVGENIAGYYQIAAAQAKSLQDQYIAQQVQNSAYGSTQDDFQSIFNAANVDWKSFLTTDIKENVRKTLGDSNMPDAAIVALAAMDSTQIASMASDVSDTTADVLEHGILEDNLPTEKNDIENILRQRFPDAGGAVSGLLSGGEVP